MHKLALEECVAKRWIAAEEELEHADETTSETQLWTKAYLGDGVVVERLLQAGADREAVPSKDEEVSICNMCGFVCALDMAADKDKKGSHEACIAVLREHGAKHSLKYAASRGLAEEVAACIADGQNLDACGEVMKFLV